MMRQKYLVVVPTQIKARMVIQIVSVLIDFCWESIEQYFSYISDEIKFNNTVYKNYTAMRGGCDNFCSGFWQPLWNRMES